MAKSLKTEKTAAPAKAEPPKKAVAPKGVKNPSAIKLNRQKRNLTLSAIQKNINLEKVNGRHTEACRKLYWQYRQQGLLGPITV